MAEDIDLLEGVNNDRVDLIEAISDIPVKLTPNPLEGVLSR
ncbi:hypothetical protein BQ8794_60103 [Mesorhizobium prunaredense]|uniref:Uncharacterized protein n=1 Tax=Mesorhizobium prunaredense TaxID=1631249 RepID=A0A1R3VK23_9HYPH|nr:hypothetical protein BQ8794_60103 [Mesorhizobium prunaredense]